MSDATEDLKKAAEMLNKETVQLIREQHMRELRDRFACAAIEKVYTIVNQFEDQPTEKEVYAALAKRCYAIADAMLTARDTGTRDGDD